MATGGSGDVLTGIIGGLLARGIEPEEAAFTGVYLHGLAGDIAAIETGENALVASDLVYAIPEITMAWERKEWISTASYGIL